jgi:hypothetical protein
MTDPTLVSCAMRDSYDSELDETSTDIECRFSDGQKFAAIHVAANHDDLAGLVCSLLDREIAAAAKLDAMLENGYAMPKPAILVREDDPAVSLVANLNHAALRGIFTVEELEAIVHFMRVEAQ